MVRYSNDFPTYREVEMASVNISLTPDQASALLDILERRVATGSIPRRMSETEAEEALVIWSLREAIRQAGVRGRRQATGVCDES